MLQLRIDRAIDSLTWPGRTGHEDGSGPMRQDK